MQQNAITMRATTVPETVIITLDMAELKDVMQRLAHSRVYGTSVVNIRPTDHIVTDNKRQYLHRDIGNEEMPTDVRLREATQQDCEYLSLIATVNYIMEVEV